MRYDVSTTTMARPSAMRTIAVASACVAISAALHGAGLTAFTREVSSRAASAVATESRLSRESAADLGSRFLRSELADRPAELAGALARWSARRAAYARIGELATLSAHERVKRLVTELFAHDRAGSYVRQSSTLARFLAPEDAGGNCEAQTKLVLGALAASGIALGPGESLGVQVFDDHVQAVVYDARTSHVWVPFTGELQEEPVAPIYQPEIMFHALLAGRGERPPVPAEALLLAKPRHRGRATASGFSTDSTLAFPPAGVRHQRGPVPERATIAAPGVDDDDRETQIVRKTNIERRNLNVREQAIAFERCPAIAPSLLHVRDEADAELFNSLPSFETRAAFLVELAERTMSRADLESTDELLRLVERGDTGGIARRVAALHAVLSTVGCTKEAVRALAIAARVYAHQPFQADDRGPLAPFAADVDNLPRVAAARSEVSALTGSIGRNPALFAERLAAMPHSVRAELLALLPTDRETYARTILPLVSAISVSVTKSDVPDTVPSPRGAPIVWMTVELTGDVPPAAASESPTAEAAPSASDLVPPPSHEPPSVGSGAVRVCADVLIDVAAFAIASRRSSEVEGPPAALLKRWSRAVEARFQERRATAPVRERAYFDAMAALGNGGIAPSP